MPEIKKPATRSASRPTAEVFDDKMASTYQSYLNLISKVKGLGRHRALRHDGNGQLVGTLNRFIDRMTAELIGSKVTPGAQTEPAVASLKQFLSSQPSK